MRGFGSSLLVRRANDRRSPLARLVFSPEYAARGKAKSLTPRAFLFHTRKGGFEGEGSVLEDEAKKGLASSVRFGRVLGGIERSLWGSSG